MIRCAKWIFDQIILLKLPNVRLLHCTDVTETRPDSSADSLRQACNSVSSESIEPWWLHRQAH